MNNLRVFRVWVFSEAIELERQRLNSTELAVERWLRAADGHDRERVLQGVLAGMAHTSEAK
eukprot:3064548-Amphidinium_carterae.2